MKKSPCRSLQDIVNEAQKKWSDIAGDKTAEESFLQLRENELPFVRYDKDGFEIEEKIPTTKRPSFVVSTSSSDSTSPSLDTSKEQADDVTEIPTKQPRLQTSQVPDVVDLLSNETEKQKAGASRIFNQKLVESACFLLCPELISEDVLNNDSFVDSFAAETRPLLTFLTKYEKYKLTIARQRKDTDLFKSISSINEKLDTLKKRMYDASEIEIKTTSGLSQLMASAKAKEEILKDILTTTMIVSNMITASNINNKMQKRTTQVTQNKEKIKKAIHHNDLSLKCFNTSLSWELAFIDVENKDHGPLNTIAMADVISAASDVQSEFCIPLARWNEDTRYELCNLLLENFPIMLVERHQKSVLIDVHEFLMQKEAFVMMLHSDDDEGGEENDNEVEETMQVNERSHDGVTEAKKRGRTPLYVKFPTLIEVATAFIKEHSFSAHVRRRETTATGAGVTLKDIKKHLEENIPGLKEAGGIHRDTIHRLTAAPRKNSTRAHRYKGLIDARVPGKRNQYREGSKNQHFLFARVKYREEFVAKFSDEAQFYSCDDMNKLRMGPATAVSRYHQIFRFFSTSDTPNVGDHDFPNAGYLIVPSGYMALTSKEQNEPIDEEYVNDELNDLINQDDFENADDGDTIVTPSDNVLVRDKLNRTHYQKFSAGPSFVKLRACMFGQSSGMTHANDMLPILQQQVRDGKGIAFIKVDNGSDWNLHSLVNIVFMGRLWRDSGLDILGLVSYAARYSAYNDIEHLWSPLSKHLSSVILPSVLEEDLVEPNKQGLEVEQQRKKEAKVFDNAMSLVTQQYWAEKTFNGSQISTAFKNCEKQEQPYNDYDVVHKLLMGGIVNLRHSELIKEFMLKHVDRKSNELIFRKCNEPNCAHCVNRPILSKNAWNFLKMMDFKWPNPKPSPTHKNHYTTFIEMCKVESDQFLTKNDGLPCNIEVGVCPYCPNFVFLSDADKKRHLNAFHFRKKGDGDKVWKLEHRCLFVIKDKQNSSRCNLLFKSANQLREHKKSSKHNRTRKSKSKKATNSSANNNGNGKKQIRLEEMMKTGSTACSELEVEVEGDESCSGANETNDVEEVGEADEEGEAGEVDEEGEADEEGDTSNNEESESESDGRANLTVTVSPGDHVVAVYVDDQRPYIGKVIDVDGRDVHITFMAPYLDESHQYFRWPKSEDKIWVDSHEILCVVPEPNPNKRGFTLPESSRKSALELYSSWK